MLENIKKVASYDFYDFLEESAADKMIQVSRLRNFKRFNLSFYLNISR